MAGSSRFGLLLIAALAAAAFASPIRADPIFSASGPEAEAYGASDNYPVARPGHAREQRYRIGTFTHFTDLFASHLVARPAQASHFARADQPLSLSYVHRGEAHTLENYLSRHSAMGLLIAKGDTILAERYQYGRTDKDRFLSQSMAKTITGLLVGLAVEDKLIRSIDDPAYLYVPGLKGSEYGNTSLRDLLHMSSGMAFTEDYGGHDDSAKLARGLFSSRALDAPAVIAEFNQRAAPAGTRFSYAGIETEILGLALRNTIGKPLADYLRDRIWQPMGAESDATWVVDGSGQETGYCCFSAVLRDYARLGLLLANDGRAGGKQLIPRDWLLAATTVRPEDGYLAPRKATNFYGYGYQVWIFPGPRRMFALLGVYGQAIFVDPESKLVLVHTAARVLPNKDPAAAELVSLWYGLIRQNGR